MLVFAGTAGFAQSDTDTTARYWKNKALPHFTLLNLDSTLFTEANLTAGKYTIIMLFNPECEHCQNQFKALVNMPEVAASAQIVLSATETMDKIKKFYTKFEVAKYPFVHIARDHNFTFGPIYQPKTIPVLVFYDQHNQFIAIKQGEAEKQQIINWLKKNQYPQ